MGADGEDWARDFNRLDGDSIDAILTWTVEDWELFKMKLEPWSNKALLNLCRILDLPFNYTFIHGYKC